MNRAANLHDIKDFRQMCSQGDACPLTSLEFRNKAGNRIIHKPFLEHVVELCNHNDTNLLDLLTVINDDIQVGMGVLGNNNPLFRRKVNSVIDEWPHDVTYDELFHKPSRNSFNYNDILSCNQDVIHLGKGMNELGQYVTNNDGSLYRRVKDLQSKCVSSHQKINNCMRNLDNINDIYEPKYPHILLDLSTRQKPFYVSPDGVDNDELLDISNRSSYEEIPNNISNIISNSIHIPNMISKETQYMKNILGKLKNNVSKKEKTLQSVINNTPERKQYEKPSHFTDFLYGLMNKKEEDYEDTVQLDSDEDTEYPNTIAPNKTSESSQQAIIRDKLSSVNHDIGSEERDNKIISTKTPVRPSTDKRQETKTFKIEPEYVPKDYQESTDLNEDLNLDEDTKDELAKDEPDEEQDDEQEDEEEDDEGDDEEDEDELDDDELDDDELDDDELDDELDDDELDDDGLGDELDAKRTSNNALSGGSRGYRLNFF